MVSDFEPEPHDDSMQGSSPEDILRSLNAAQADGQTYTDWARLNPDFDYRIRMLNIPENISMREDAERQLRNFSRVAMSQKIITGAFGLIGTISVAVGVSSAAGWESGVIQAGIIPGIIFGGAGVLELLAARRMWQNSISQIDADLEIEKDLFKKYFGEPGP